MVNSIFLIIVIIYDYLLYWILKLENIGCECSKDWRRNFIMCWIIIYIFIMIFETFIKNKIMKNVLVFLIFLFQIIFIIIVFQYVRKLKNEKCKCADGNERRVLEIFNYFQIFITLIALFFLLQVIYYFIKKSKL